MGYSEEQKRYRCYNPLTKKVVVTCDVIFDELGSWCNPKQNAKNEDEDDENEDRNKSENESGCYGNGNKVGQQSPTSIACIECL